MQRWFKRLLTPALLALWGLVWLAPTPVWAGVYNSDTEVTYKEYWIPHSQFTGGHTNPGCIDTNPNGTFYTEPTGNCTKTLRFTIPDDMSQALRAEIYFDLWRNHAPQYDTKGQLTRKTSATFRLNSNLTWFETHPIGYEWSRTPMVAETVRATDSNGAVIAETVTPVLNLLRQGENTLLLKQIGGLYHIHDIGIRIYFDDQHPLVGPNGQPIQAPNGSLTTIWHDGGLVDAAAGGTLTVNDDQLVLSANVTTPARFVEFHGYYRGYDLDNDDSDGDKTALDTEWHNRLRNNWLPGGLEPNSLGGVIDHIGTLATPSPGAYSIYWDIPHLLNQPNVKFKIRIVDDNYVVREAAGGVSAPFTLQRSKEIVAYSKPDWNDFVLHHGGNRPQTVTVSINLPSNLVVGDYNDAYVLGSYWNNPFLAINSNPKFRAFTSNEDNWTLSMRKLASVTQLRAGSNQFTYSYSGSGFGQFIEKPGPLILLKQTTRAPDNSPPQISQRTPGVNAQNVSPTAAIALTVGDPGRGVNLNTLKLFVNGLQVQPQISGSPDAYSLTYTPPTEFLPNTTVTVRVEGCDYANRCISASNGAYSFTVQGSQHTFSAVASGRGAVQVTPQKALYNYGESVALTATPDPGWVFMGWQGAMDGWGDPLRNYRIPLVVNANGFGRVDKPVEAQINFTTLFANLGQNNTFDPATLLVVEVDEGGQIVDSNVPFQFDRAADYNAAAKASGVLVFLMKGNTEAAGKRTYHVYFDIAGRGITAPTFTNLVTRSNVTDQGQASFRFVTSKATYDFHKFGGGFSSVVDNDGNDWVDFRPTPVSGAGFFRGIPNMRPPPDGYFHPGNEIGATSVVNEGPLKHTISTVTTDGKWEVQWEFFPTYARMTVLKRDPSKNYWVLYEGVPGGSLDVNSDTYTLSDGTTATLVNSFGGDLPSPEWIYFSDPPLGRSLFLVHHDDDSIVDSYRLDNSNPANAKMVIFGFGRALSGNTTHLNAVPNVFTIGFMDETAFTPASAVIDAAYRGLLVSVGSVQAQSLGSQAGASSANFTITGNTVLTALFEPPVSYTLSTTVNGDGAVELNPDFPVYAPGDMVTLTAVANPGAIFTGWAGDASGSNPSITVMMDGNKSITANFDYIPYEVATSVVGNGAIVKEPDQPTYRYGDVITVTATSPSNWRFTGWGGDLTGDDNPALLTVDGAKTLTATFVELHTLAVQYSGQGWVNVSPEEAEYLHGVAVTLTATPDDGWAFTGWSGDLAGDANPATLTMDASKSVTANFVPLYPLSITIIGDGGAVERTPDASDYLAGAQVTLTAVANPGWRFTGWSGDAQSNEPSITLTMDSAKAVTATFVEEEYTLTLNTQGEGGITVDPAKPFYRYGDEVILTATPAEGWVFSAWNGDALSGENPYTLLIDGDKTVTAQFLDAAFTLTTATDGSGTIVVTPNLPHYAPGAEVTVEAAPEAGWAFTGWSGDLAGDINPATLIMDGDKSVVAHFTQNPVTLAVQVAGQGNVVVTPQKAVYSLGETVTLLAVPDRGSLFSSWGGDATGSVNPLTLVMDGSKTVTATFTPAQYTVAVDVVGEGAVEVSPAKATYSHNETITLMANPAPGWRFVAWGGHLSGSEPTVQTPVRRNLRITAAFVEEGVDTVSLTTAVVGGGQVEVTPAQASYLPGAVVTLTAQPAAGWLFVEWSGDLSGDANPATLILNTDKAVTATFVATPAGFVTTKTTGGQVKLNPDKPFYAVGDEVTLEAIPDQGWRFDQWEVTGSALAAGGQTTQNPLPITVDGERTYTPRFVPDQAGGGDETILYLPVIRR